MLIVSFINVKMRKMQSKCRLQGRGDELQCYEGVRVCVEIALKLQMHYDNQTHTKGLESHQYGLWCVAHVCSNLWITAICWTDGDLHHSVSNGHRDRLRAVRPVHCKFHVFVWHLGKQRHGTTVEGNNNWGGNKVYNEGNRNQTFKPYRLFKWYLLISFFLKCSDTCWKCILFNIQYVVD